MFMVYLVLYFAITFILCRNQNITIICFFFNGIIFNSNNIQLLIVAILLIKNPLKIEQLNYKNKNLI